MESDARIRGWDFHPDHSINTISPSLIIGSIFTSSYASTPDPLVSTTSSAHSSWPSGEDSTFTITGAAVSSATLITASGFVTTSSTILPSATTGSSTVSLFQPNSSSDSQRGTTTNGGNDRTVNIVIAVFVPILCILLAAVVVLLYRRRSRRHSAARDSQEPVPFVINAAHTDERVMSLVAGSVPSSYIGRASRTATLGRPMSTSSTPYPSLLPEAADGSGIRSEKAQRVAQLRRSQRPDYDPVEEYSVFGGSSDIPSEAPPSYYSG